MSPTARCSGSSSPPCSRSRVSPGAESSGLPRFGLAYGVVVWIGLAVVVMPIWLSVGGFPMAPPLPNVDVGSLLGHAAYGVVLGITYGFHGR
ncbi:hypothetical protein [Natronococcus occultus]|uniref:Histidine kinase n=1 Tax=Natronococcus occultus SP4 TaxID=694430 RepID=L0JV91_9EURY|nr:hypothetical protein [Natronococcus occultus]AGB36034.1 hypothetical protein Natoc_0154 [Natronococcus occultus SP4]